jgi:hypothetical protein
VIRYRKASENALEAFLEHLVVLRQNKRMPERTAITLEQSEI